MEQLRIRSGAARGKRKANPRRDGRLPKAGASVAQHINEDPTRIAAISSSELSHQRDSSRWAQDEDETPRTQDHHRRRGLIATSRQPINGPILPSKMPHMVRRTLIRSCAREEERRRAGPDPDVENIDEGPIVASNPMARHSRFHVTRKTTRPLAGAVTEIASPPRTTSEHDSRGGWREPTEASNSSSDEFVKLIGQPDGPTSPKIPLSITRALSTIHWRSRVPQPTSPLLRRSLRHTFIDRCKKQGIPTKPSPEAQPERVHMKIFHRGASSRTTFEHIYTSSDGWACVLCTTLGKLPTQAALQYHYDSDHADFRSTWTRVPGRRNKMTWEHVLVLTEQGSSPSNSSDPDDMSGSEGLDGTLLAIDSASVVSSEDCDAVIDLSNSFPPSQLPSFWSLRRTLPRIKSSSPDEGTNSLVQSDVEGTTPDLNTSLQPMHTLSMGASSSTITSRTASSAASDTELTHCSTSGLSLEALIPQEDSDISVIGSSAPRRRRVERPVKFEPEVVSPQHLRPHSSTFIGPDGRPWLKPPPDHIHGPAVQKPILPFTSQDGRKTLTHSCRPGGARLYDLLDLVPLEAFGVVDWWVVEKEEDLFEYPDMRCEEKVMLSVWSRWVFFNQHALLANRLKSMETFVNENWWIIHHAAGWDALRSQLVALVEANFLSFREMAHTLRFYRHLLKMDQWYAGEVDE